MRRIATLLAAAAVVAVGLSTAQAQAHDGWGGYQRGNHQSGEHAWQGHEWRERAGRHHEWREQRRWNPGNYGSYGYYTPPRYYAPGVTFGYR